MHLTSGNLWSCNVRFSCLGSWMYQDIWDIESTVCKYLWNCLEQWTIVWVNVLAELEHSNSGDQGGGRFLNVNISVQFTILGYFHCSILPWYIQAPHLFLPSYSVNSSCLKNNTKLSALFWPSPVHINSSSATPLLPLPSTTTTSTLLIVPLLPRTFTNTTYTARWLPLLPR